MKPNTARWKRRTSYCSICYCKTFAGNYISSYVSRDRPTHNYPPHEAFCRGPKLCGWWAHIALQEEGEGKLVKMISNNPVVEEKGEPLAPDATYTWWQWFLSLYGTRCWRKDRGHTPWERRSYAKVMILFIRLTIEQGGWRRENTFLRSGWVQVFMCIFRSSRVEFKGLGKYVLLLVIRIPSSLCD